MSKRQIALERAKVAGYHNDSPTFVRLMIESRVRNELMSDAWRDGWAAKQSGVPCVCGHCAHSKPAPKL